MADADLQRKQAARWRFINALYDVTDGSPALPVVAEQISRRAGLDSREGVAAVDYLAGEGLLTQNFINFSTATHAGLNRMVAIAHKGVKEVEEARAGGGKNDTEHFPRVVQNFHNSTIGAVQIGGQGNMAQATQTVGLPAGDVVALAKTLLEKAREHGDDEAIALADKAHEHAAAGRFERMKVYVQGLTAIAALVPYAKPLLDMLANVGM
jgi:hypothetical protein